jgi:hypothetical protein
VVNLGTAELPLELIEAFARINLVNFELAIAE